ncbi:MULTISPECIES: DUF2924 domain-containing protein [unclassified Sphingomonas]|uniref:DUF2924 domain-containing protein n=1 Tax=unclassified Sphingomonas TaxID=196159 RepID=UPI0006F82733|nr:MULTISPECIES: DUF2924 domain-containing protein [unclassified Sphingomonas]KQX22831.1 hypothetical protein ASD17_04845 [Sphingomonas sp. Root1294]KQY67894.1 hypothetical protein ASD39_08285 [Sphingomonas sp. Root50]KRB88818.1 hypothetical protein ASE22_20630 [Sphingomonas sp. Root720]
MAGIDDQLAGLATLSQAQLRTEWRKYHKGQLMPLGLGRDLASRAIAWQMQERVRGGLTTGTRRELKRLTKQLVETGDIDLGKDRSMKPGTKLVRQWHGIIYHVLVLEDGFQFQDRQYRSLTPIAREITGAAWSGPRFFGLKEKPDAAAQ